MVRPILVILFSALCSPQNVSADTLPHLEGWSSTGTSAGLQLAGREIKFSTPVIAEINGDPNDGREVAAAGSDGRIYVFRSSGVLLWARQIPPTKCTRGGKGSSIASSPAVGALFGDGIPYIVVGYGSIDSRRCDGGVAAFRGPDGNPSWQFSTRTFSRRAKFGTRFHTVFSTPALADTDGDGRMEIAFGSFDRNVYLLNADGSVRWYYNAADTIWSSAAFANVDSDPDLEVIIGTDISANKRLRPPTKNGGYVYAFKAASRRPTRIPFRQKGGFVWQTWFHQTIFSAPVIADFLPENPGPEVIVGSGCYFPERTNQKLGRWVKVLSLQTGAVLRTFETPACLSSTVGVGDLDGDGQNEIVATVNGARDYGGDGQGRVIAWKSSASAPLWSVVPRYRDRADPYLGFFNSPVIADLDGNGSLEVAVAVSGGIAVLNGRDGSQLSCSTKSCDGSAHFANARVSSTPAAGDINGDGTLELVGAGAYGRSQGGLYVWTGFHKNLGSSAGSLSPYLAPWPMFRGNASRNGNNG